MYRRDLPVAGRFGAALGPDRWLLDEGQHSQELLAESENVLVV